MKHDISKPLFGYVCFTALCTLVLVVAGGLVTSTGSGLAVPDWPLSYGQLMPPMVGGIFYEHGHRMIATFVGILVIGMAIWVGRKESRSWVRWMAYSALGLVILQGVLGGITVLFLLPTPVSVAHATTGQLFFSLISCTALVLSSTWRDAKPVDSDRRGKEVLPRLGLFMAITVLIQLILGAVIRHANAAHAIPDFPLVFGGLVPESWTRTIAIHYAHRVWALVVILSISLFFIRAFNLRKEDQTLYKMGQVLFLLLFLQIILAALTIWTRIAVIPTTAHVAVGACILALSIASTLYSSYRFGLRDRHERAVPRRSFRDFWALGKPRITFMVCLTTAIGYYLAIGNSFHPFHFFMIMLATFFVASGASTWNQAIEKDLDRMMERTKNRPLPSGKISVVEAWIWGFFWVFAGLLLFGLAGSFLASLMAFFTVFSYALIYTPLKRITSWNTVIGAVPGAMPPVIGWTAVTNSLSLEAWILFAILFLWQLPHFYAIAWLYKEDYARASFPMLPVIDENGERTVRHLFFWSILLILVALFPYFAKMAGLSYLFGVLVLGVGFWQSIWKLIRLRSKLEARRVLLASVLYLPLLMILLAASKISHP